MARFRERKDLDQVVARMIVPDVTRITRAAGDGAKEAAPPEKVWLTKMDEKVRPEHVKAHRQAVPKNLRFTLDTPEYDQRNYATGPIQMGRKPRDKKGFTPGNTAECRCFLGEIPDGVSKTIKAHAARAAGTRVTGRVTCDHKLASPAEYGNSQDQGARFMGKGLRAGKRAARRR